MDDFRSVGEDILKEWLEYRESSELAYTDEEDRKHHIYMDKFSERILKNVPKRNHKYVNKQLENIDFNYMDYATYWNEKYYRNGFCDAIQLLLGSLCSNYKKHH